MAKDKKKKEKGAITKLWERAARSGLRGTRAQETQKRKDSQSGYRKKKRRK